MNILTQKLPQSVEIDGVEYPINSDFRTCLTIILAFEDMELTDTEKYSIMLNLLYDEIPEDHQKACEMAIKFLNCGEEPKQQENEIGTNGERLYSFEKDAKYIYSAIKQTHGVDLETVDYLHWWKFCYMFLDINEDCFFSKIIYYRRQRSKGKLTKEEREYCNTIKDILDLPQIFTSEEVAARNEFMRLLGTN